MDFAIGGQQLVAAILFSFLGVLMFGISFFIIDKTTPGNFWHEIIEEHNTALSLIFCGFAIGISIIIAAAIGG